MSENRQRSQVTEDEKLRIMKDIEAKTENIVKNCILSEEIMNPINQDDAINILQNIMRSGGDEFKEKVGRPMTYSEMREMFG
jgi:hypothetical protein